MVGTNIFFNGLAPAADWVVAPSIGFQELGTDNINQTETNRKADAISQLTPGIAVTEQGPNSHLFLSYAPIFSADIAESGQDRVDQNLLGNGRVSLFDQLLTVDFNTFVTQGSGSGGSIATGASDLVPLGDRTLNFGGTVAPHLRLRFGDAASLDAYYQVSSSNTTGQNETTDNNQLSSSLLEQDAKLIVGSGDSFNRLSLSLYLEHANGTGSGNYNQFDNDTDLLKFQYHFTHEYSLIGYAGYQSINYYSTATIPGYSEHGLVWSGGIRVTPNDFTVIELSYSRQSGAYAPEASVKYDLSPRTHFYFTYAVSVENQLQENLSYLQNLGTSLAGAPIDITTGLPFNNTNNQLFGSENVLYRDKLATLAVTRQFTRSSITLSGGNEQRQALSGSISPDTAWYGNVTYSRDLTPNLQGYADIGYSRRTFSETMPGPREDDKLYNADISLSYRINPTITATAIYSFFKRNSNIVGFSTTTSQILVGIRKVF